MATFNTQKFLSGNPSLIPVIASRIESAFIAEGYNVVNQPLISGAADISISKGGVFKAVLGMRTALKVSLKPQSNGIAFDAGVGIFGQQIIPAIIMWFYAWPVLLTQIWGMVQQSKLDDKALAIAEETIQQQGGLHTAPSGAKHFCTSCGSELPVNASFCSHCGAKQ